MTIIQNNYNHLRTITQNHPKQLHTHSKQLQALKNNLSIEKI